jgi:hypothetical protein
MVTQGRWNRVRSVILAVIVGINVPVAVYASDPLPPTVTVTINGGASTTIDPLLTITLAVSGATPPVTMRFSEDGGATWTAWEPFATTKQLQLPQAAPFGTYTVVAEVRDGLGTTTQGADDIVYVEANRTSMTGLETSYLFHANLNWDQATIDVLENVKITNRSGGLIGYVNFSVPPKAFGEFTLLSVRVDGRDVETTWTNNANLRVSLGRNLRDGDTATVTFDFRVVAKNDVSTSLRSRLSKANGIMQVSQWFPIVSNGHELRDPGDSQVTASAQSFSLDLTTNRPLVLAAPGLVEASASTSFHVDLGPARDFAFAVAPDFKVARGSVDGISVEVYYRSGYGTSALSYAKQALYDFNRAFGAYPYRRFVVVQSSQPGGGIETPGLVYVSREYLGSAYVVRHETAHQWWYALVGNDQLRSPWLDEAFAEWSARWGGASYCSGKYVTSSIYTFPNRDLSVDATSCGSYFQTIYRKGSAVLQGIRYRMGSTYFIRALKAIVAEHRFGIVTTKDVVETFLRYTPSSQRSIVKTYLTTYLRW